MQTISTDVLKEKYAKGDEQTADDVFRRVARALAAIESDPAQWEPRFLDAMRAGFIPAGRILSAAGTDLQATLINCFVQPVGDAMRGFESGKPGIMDALAQAAETMRRGGGVGYDFSRIRPQGAKVKGTASNASGPISYMRVFDTMCQTVESAGARRGAQMGILRCDHPDILDFIDAKNQAGQLSNFNLSVGVLYAFMVRVESDADWDLVHVAEPSDEQQAQGAYQRDDGLWVYRTLPARELWERITWSTYDHAEPGVLFLDRAHADNNLAYCETLEAVNPCAEQWLPDYGCCCLGSLDLTRFVKHPFHAPSFDWYGFEQTVAVAVRMLDNVLDVTHWPLPEQNAEAQAKRRVGLGFLGLGDALIMMDLKYDTPAARGFAAEIACRMRDAAYLAAVELAREKGAFPLFDADAYLAGGFASRLPESIRERIRAEGIRNSHLLSIAPTGTISLAFADNASNGIEPPFSWTYRRKKRTADGGHEEYDVEDHAYRQYRGGDVVEHLPPHWITALEISAIDHMRMVAAVQPFIDSAISKTVNVPADYPFTDFQDLYLEAWRAGLKGLATYRPNAITGAVLSVDTPPPAPTPDPDPGRVRLDQVPEPVLASLRWQRRPRPAAGNPAWTYLVDHPRGDSFAIFVGHLDDASGAAPFEVWTTGTEQTRGLGALAKSLSMDMRSQDRGWLDLKLVSLMRTVGDDGFHLTMPPAGDRVWMPSVVAAFAHLVHYRCTQLGAFAQPGPTPLIDALIGPKEPKIGTAGTLSWTVDVSNPATGDDFILALKELILPDGTPRPYSLWLSGHYPRALNGLGASLSLDLRILDPAWVGAKLRQLADFQEPRGDFLAWVPGERRQTNYPSTVAYLAALILHRFGQLGILDPAGRPLRPMGAMLETGHPPAPEVFHDLAVPLARGPYCHECGCPMTRRDGCDFCTACGAVGACG